MAAMTDEQMFGEAQERLRAAMPKGWRALRPLYRTVALDGREPIETWELSIQWATDIEGGRTRYYGDTTKTGIEKSGRRLEVTLRGASIDDLVTALKALPAKGLEKMAALRWPIEVTIEGVNLPY